jgi:hypothetical protein
VPQHITIRPVFPLDRRRLVEAKIARECELMRLEVVMKQAADHQALPAAASTARSFDVR